LNIPDLPAEFIPRLVAFSGNADAVSISTSAICVLTIGIALGASRLKLKVPGPLLALLVSTAIVHFANLPVETIGDRFGPISATLPAPRLPHIELARVPDLVAPAIAIALLSGIESLLSAVVADGMTGRRHRSNIELIAQGVANLSAPLFGGIPATGAIARTATNIKNGARTPVAGIIHALTLLGILSFAGRWAVLIPMATLAGILLVVAYNMSEWRLFAGLLRGPRSDVLVLVVTFLLTVLVDLTTAIQAGVVLAALLFMHRMAEATQVRTVRDAIEYDERNDDAPTTAAIPDGVEVFEILGSFCFGATQKFTEVLGEIRQPPRVVILRMRHVLAIDATGLRALDEARIRLERSKTAVILSGVQPQVRAAMERSGLLDRIGRAYVFDSFTEALETVQSPPETPR
jgi:SulP family sulfate permease